MRTFVIAATLLAATSSFAGECGPQNSEIIALTDWSATPGDYGSVDVSMKMKSNAEKQIRMLKATALFVDPFGDKIAKLALDPDVVIPPNGTRDERGSWSAARLTKVRKEDVTALVCVSAVLYEDGTKEAFE